MSKECCGTCKWHEYDKAGKDWVCVNDASENVADFTGYEDSCDEWEGKDDQKADLLDESYTALAQMRRVGATYLHLRL